MNPTLAASPLTEAQLTSLVDRYEAGLAEALRTAFGPPLRAHGSALEAWVEEVRSQSTGCLERLESRLESAAATGRDAMLTALDEAGSEYTAEVIATLDEVADEATTTHATGVISTLLEALDALPESFPKQVRAVQTDARFAARAGDTGSVRALKSMKRALRPLRRRWERVIPVADAVRFEAVAFEEHAGLETVCRARLTALLGVMRLYSLTLAALDDAATLARGAEADDALAAAKPILASAREAIEEQAVLLVEDVRSSVARVFSGAEVAASASRESLAEALETLGTVERPARRVGPTRAARARNRVRERRLEALEAWAAEEEAREDSLRAEAEVVRVAYALQASAVEAAAEVHASIGARLREPIQALREALGRAVKAAESGFEKELPVAEILGEVEAMVEEAFARSADLVENSERAWREVLAPIVALRDGVARLHRAVAESRILVAGADRIPDEPAPSAPRPVPLRKFVALHCVGRVGRDVAELLAAAGPEIEAARTEVERLRQAAAFNLTAALQESVDEASVSAELVEGVLHRAVGRLDALLEAGAALEDSLSEGLRARLDALAEAMVAPVRARDAHAIRQAVLAEGAKERLDSSLASGREATLAALVAVRDGVIRGARRLAELWRWARGRTGLVAVEAEAMAESLDEAVLDTRMTERLPLVYRQLFTLEPLEWDDFLVGRDEALDRIAAAHDRWAAGRPCAVAVYGEKGSGKTTLLNAVTRRLPESMPVTTVRFKGVERSVDGLLAALAAHFGAPGARGFGELAERIRRAPGVVILEHAHHLFLREVGGFEAVRALLELIQATNASTFWIVSMDRYAWRLLDQTTGMGEHFLVQVDTSRLSAEELERAILTRHHVSGYALRFEPDERMRRSRTLRRSANDRDAQEAIRARYFERLDRIAEGNILVALYHWLRSIEAVEGHTLVVGMPRALDFGFLDQLPDATLYTVAAMIQHGGLSPEEHARIFQATFVKSRLHLGALADSRILFLSEDGRYSLNKLLYRQMVRVLVDRGVMKS